MKLAIWTAMLVTFVYFAVRQFTDGAVPLAIGPALLWLGMICWQFRESVTRVRLRQGLAFACWGLLASSLAVSLYFDVLLSRRH